MWTLADIRAETRQLTGRLTSDDISTSELDKKINEFYTLTLPAELKLDKQLHKMEIITQANQQDYALPDPFTNPTTPGFIDKLPIDWYQSPAWFLENSHQNVSRKTSIGDGVQQTFAFTAGSFPLIPGSVIVTDDAETFTDNGTTVLSGDNGGTGTVDYLTGDINVTFFSAPQNGRKIYFTYIHYKAGRPIQVLYFNETFTFFPIPDQAYRFECSAYAAVEPLVNATDRPPLAEWGPMIVYGTAIRIHTANAEWDAVQAVSSVYKRQLNLSMRRTHQNLLNERVSPRF